MPRCRVKRCMFSAFASVTTLVGIVLAFTGCSLAIYRSGISGWDEIPLKGVTRKEIHERFGQPVSSALCADGRRIDVHAIRQKVYQTGEDMKAIIGGDIATLGLFELFFTPIAIVESERAKVYFAFVYAADEVLASRTNTSKGTEATALCDPTPASTPAPPPDQCSSCTRAPVLDGPP